MSSATTPGSVTKGGVTDDSVIHDIGFRHYDGPRLGRGWAFRSLLVETLRGAFGLGRPAKIKAMPWILTGFAILPAVIMVTVVMVTGLTELPIPYSQYVVGPIWLVIAMFVAGRAPYAISRDLRDGVMPLYLSRPILGRDYVLAKLSGLAIAMFLFLSAPLVVLLCGALLAKFPVWNEVWAWLGAEAMAGVLAILLTALSMVLASVTRRRGLGVAVIMTALVLTTGFSNILVQVVGDEVSPATASYFSVLDPFMLVDALGAAWLGVEPITPNAQPDGWVGGLALTAALIAIVAAFVGILIRRFKKVGGV